MVGGTGFEPATSAMSTQSPQFLSLPLISESDVETVCRNCGEVKLVETQSSRESRRAKELHNAWREEGEWDWHKDENDQHKTWHSEKDWNWDRLAREGIEIE